MSGQSAKREMERGNGGSEAAARAGSIGNELSLVFSSPVASIHFNQAFHSSL